MTSLIVGFYAGHILGSYSTKYKLYHDFYLADSENLTTCATALSYFRADNRHAGIMALEYFENHLANQIMLPVQQPNGFKKMGAVNARYYLTTNLTQGRNQPLSQ